MYYWFLYLAFVYVPYGQDVQHALADWKMFSWTAIPDDMFNIKKIQIDEFFVTPLVATQAINLILESCVPRLLKWLRVRASTAVEERTATADRFTEYMRGYLDCDETELPLLGESDDLNAFRCPELLVESSISEYDTFGDYMDMSMQCGYVLLFSIAWPLTAVCAAINNALEIRSDVYRVTCARRAVPQAVGDIGNWLNMFKIGVFVALWFTSFLFTMSTGGLEHFIPGCDTSLNDEIEIMRPTFNDAWPNFNTSTSVEGPCTDKLAYDGSRVYLGLGIFAFNCLVAFVTFSIYDDTTPKATRLAPSPSPISLC